MQNVVSQTKTIFDSLGYCLENRHTFAIYRLPGESDITMILQKDQVLSEISDQSKLLDKKGFLIAPFSNTNGNKTYIIRPDFIFKNYLNKSDFKILQNLPSKAVNGYHRHSFNEINKSQYIKQIASVIDEIKNGAYDKVVLSRVKKVFGSYMHQLSDIYSLLCESHPNAFVYLFNLEGQCWIGATPEPLIYSRAHEELYTVSLAGTRPFTPDNMDITNWNHKEKVEQEYVTQFISQVLAKHEINDVRQNGPYTKKAGSLVHLRTNFSFAYKQASGNLPSLINSLHPTSAVCGMPMESSREYILHTENHNREYYAGYLGPLGINERLQLFVNLRCMKVQENELSLFIGGGITSESIPEEEWEETEIKAETLLSIVQQI